MKGSGSFRLFGRKAGTPTRGKLAAGAGSGLPTCEQPGCESTSVLPCAYQDRWQSKCGTHWCSHHVTFVGEVPCCPEHAPLMSALTNVATGKKAGTSRPTVPIPIIPEAGKGARHCAVKGCANPDLWPCSYRDQDGQECGTWLCGDHVEFIGQNRFCHDHAGLVGSVQGGRCGFPRCENAEVWVCSYRDRHGRECGTNWCRNHVRFIGAVPFCQEHGGLVGTLAVGHGSVRELKTVPTLDDRCASLAEFIGEEVDQEVVGIIRERYTGRTDVRLMADERVRDMWYQTQLVWWRTWGALTNAGYVTRIAIWVPMVTPPAVPTVHVLVDSNVVFKEVPDWILRDQRGEPPDPDDVVQFHGRIINSIRAAIDMPAPFLVNAGRATPPSGVPVVPPPPPPSGPPPSGPPHGSPPASAPPAAGPPQPAAPEEAPAAPLSEVDAELPEWIRQDAEHSGSWAPPLLTDPGPPDAAALVAPEAVAPVEPVSELHGVNGSPAAPIQRPPDMELPPAPPAAPKEPVVWPDSLPAEASAPEPVTTEAPVVWPDDLPVPEAEEEVEELAVTAELEPVEVLVTTAEPESVEEELATTADLEPVEEPLAPAPPGEPAPSPEVGLGVSAEVRLTGSRRLLVVGEDEETAEGLAELVSEVVGLEVVGVVADPILAIDEAAKLHPDVLVVDLKLSSNAGLWVTERMAAELPHIPVVLLAEDDASALLRRAYEAGARDVLVWPFTADVLTVAIRRALQTMDEDTLGRDEHPLVRAGTQPPLPSPVAGADRPGAAAEAVAPSRPPPPVQAPPPESPPAGAEAVSVMPPPPPPPPPTAAPPAAGPDVAPAASAPPPPSAAAPSAPPTQPPAAPAPASAEAAAPPSAAQSLSAAISPPPDEAPAEPMPRQPVQIRSDKGEITVIFSGKGGVGKSLIAVNLAVALSEALTSDIGVVDLDLQFGDLALLLDVKPQTSIFNVVEGYPDLDPEFLSSLMPAAATGLRLLVGTPSPELSDLVTSDHIRVLLEGLRSLFPHIIVDLGAHLDDRSLEAVQAADRIILVTDLDLSTIKNAKLALALFDRLSIPAGRIHVLVNRADTKMSVGADQVAEMLNHPVTGYLPTDTVGIHEAVRRATPLLKLRPDLPLSRAIRELVEIAGFAGVPQRATKPR